MTSAELNLDDAATRQFVAEYLDARVAGILGPDWSAAEYVARRQRDEQRKLIGGLFAEFDDDTFFEELNNDNGNT